MEFKKAEMIELHDSKTVVHLESYSDAAIGWSDCIETEEEFRVSADGVDLVSSVLQNRKYKSREWEFAELITKCSILDVGANDDTHKITSLFVKIDAPKLITIRFTSRWDHKDAPPEFHTQDVIYSGAFTVWFKYEEKAVSASDPLKEME